jgi:hypothetical protein
MKWAPVLACALLACTPRSRGPRPSPRPADAAATSAVTVDVPRVVARDAGPPFVLRVRVVNSGATPLTLLTNPDRNELLHAYRINVADDTSDRAAALANGTRVSFFPIGQMALCSDDAGAGYGGLGQPGSITLQPGEGFDAADWDGRVRQEVNDPARGVCARESAPQPGRYRLQLDQPQLEGRPVCSRVMVRVPPAADAGPPILEIRCRAATPAAPGAG